MSSDALLRARQEALKEVSRTSGDYLDADTLIANKLVFDIVDVIFDQGGGYAGSDRWLVKVEPHYENEEDPSGLITLSAGSTENGEYRQNFVRKRFMEHIQKELNEMEAAGKDVYIGPAVLVKLKGTKYRFNEIVPWDENAQQPILPEGAVLAGASANDDMRVRRPRSRPEPEPEENVARPSFAEAGAGKAETASAPAVQPAPSATDIPAQTDPSRTDIPFRPEVTSTHPATDESPQADTIQVLPDKPRRRESSRARSDVSGHPISTHTDFPPLNEWAKGHGYSGKGRIPNALKEQYEEAKAYHEGRLDDNSAHKYSIRKLQKELEDETLATVPQLTPDMGAQWHQARAEAVSTRSADPPVGAPSRMVAPPPGGAQTAREQVFRPGMIGRTVQPCSSCGQHITDRIFPNPETGGFSLIHYGCTAGAPQQSMDAVPIKQAES